MNGGKVILILSVVLLSPNLFAYGSSSSKKACKKPKFTKFNPPHLTSVEALSSFSFKASSLTNPDSISVDIKKNPVELTIKKLNNGYSVTGMLPESLTASHARINIKAKGTNGCKGSDGWLLKVQ